MLERVNRWEAACWLGVGACVRVYLASAAAGGLGDAGFSWCWCMRVVGQCSWWIGRGESEVARRSTLGSSRVGEARLCMCVLV